MNIDGAWLLVDAMVLSLLGVMVLSRGCAVDISDIYRQILIKTPTSKNTPSN